MIELSVPPSKTNIVIIIFQFLLPFFSFPPFFFFLKKRPRVFPPLFYFV